MHLASTVICFRITPKTKIDFVKNLFCVKIPVFPILIVFTGAFENTGNIKF